MGNDWMPSSRKGNKHALVIPVCMQAHIVNILRHALELARRGVTVTFVSRARDIANLTKLDHVQQLDFNLLSYEDFGSCETSTDRANDPFEFVLTARNLFQPILEKLVADRKAGLPGPTCVISDRLLTFAQDVANELNLPHYQFYSCGASWCSVLQAYHRLFADGTLTMENDPTRKGFFKMGEFEGRVTIPGLPALRWGEMMQLHRLGVEVMLDMSNRMVEADGFIVNTFYELESPQIDAIRKTWEEDSPGKLHKLFLVGPFSTAAPVKEMSFVAKPDDQGHDCMQWLDSRPTQSVVYICFGSLVRFSPEQISELALALEASEQSFLWVLSRGVGGEAFSNLEEVLPPKFQARTRERGMIVDGWVPQQQILAHPSIGGFVTHCGWNSVIESITSGVPMIAWPQMNNDQFINCRHIVDVLKIAVAVEVRTPISSKTNGEQTKTTISRPTVGRVELEKGLRLLMSKEGSEMRSRAQKLKMKADAAVADGGASKEALNDLEKSIPTGIYQIGTI
ncbi:hypothetical protein Mapa_011162 [Marchantia paleacea]|nr:hypothetical protein Mapa_011162 [Marchantia paleacea]